MEKKILNYFYTMMYLQRQIQYASDELAGKHGTPEERIEWKAILENSIRDQKSHTSSIYLEHHLSGEADYL